MGIILGLLIGLVVLAVGISGVVFVITLAFSILLKFLGGIK